MGKVITIANQKGGTGKSTTCVNLGIGLARKGRKVLLIDTDAQGNISDCLGIDDPHELEYTVVTVMQKIINEEPIDLDQGIIHHKEGVDILPGNIEIAGLELTLISIMSRETVLRQYISLIRERYDFIIIDTMPSFGMMTMNALVAADSVLIPAESAHLSVKGMQQLLRTIARVRRQLNPALTIEGILITKLDRRTNFSKDVAEKIREAYKDKIYIFKNCIPLSIKAGETSAEGKSIYLHAPGDIVANGYAALTEEVLSHEQS